jgi:hypothetical protein
MPPVIGAGLVVARPNGFLLIVKTGSGSFGFYRVLTLSPFWTIYSPDRGQCKQRLTFYPEHSIY